MTKRTIKIDSYAWIMENGVLNYGFYLGDGDEPVEFSTTLKQAVRDTINSYCLIDGCMADYHIEDAEQLYFSLIAAANIVKQELNRVKEHND